MLAQAARDIFRGSGGAGIRARPAMQAAVLAGDEFVRCKCVGQYRLDRHIRAEALVVVKAVCADKAAGTQCRGTRRKVRFVQCGCALLKQPGGECFRRVIGCVGCDVVRRERHEALGSALGGQVRRKQHGDARRTLKPRLYIKPVRFTEHKLALRGGEAHVACAHDVRARSELLFFDHLKIIAHS